MKWHWSEDELEMQWSLSVAELALLPGRTDSGRLGYAILLKFFQFQGFFPNNKNDGTVSGQLIFLQLKSGDSYVRKLVDGKEVFVIKNQRHAEYWENQIAPVMLVIRNSDGEIQSTYNAVASVHRMLSAYCYLIILNFIVRNSFDII